MATADLPSRLRQRAKSVVTPAYFDNSSEEDSTLSIPASAAKFDGFIKWMRARRTDSQFPIVHFAAGALWVGMTCDADMLEIPRGALSFAGFRKWADSDAFPERGKIWYANEELHLDMSPEEVTTHLLIKSALSFAIEGFRRQYRLGLYIPDGVRLELPAERFSAEPDGTFIRYATLESGRAVMRPGRDGPRRITRISGHSDWVCEIVSRSSVDKDTRILRKAYHRAGVTEYWLIDARGVEIDFQLLKRNQRSYAAAKPADGWMKSPVFDCWVRLTRAVDEAGIWEYRLDMERRT